MSEYDAGTVKATMKADGSGLHTAVETAKKDISGLGKEAKEAKADLKELGITSGVAFGVLTAGAFKAAQTNNQLKASFMGLDSIAKGTIGNYSKIEKELEKVREDGMIPLNNAVTTYKNLLNRYKDEETAITMFHRLADAAAFGRQGHLTLGEAIQGASEGLKNEMSQMVDNAGVTKNVSVMWKDYAAQIGKTVGQLTDAEKRQAEVNGIMEETRFQVGDLSKLQNSLSGEMSKVNALSTEIAAVWGDSLEPAGTGVVSATTGILSGLKEFIKANPAFVAGITAGTMALTGLTAAGAGWNLVWPKVVTGFGLISGPIGIALIAVSALTGVIIGLTTAQQKELEKMKKLSQEYKDQSREIYNLAEEHKRLKGNTKLTTDEKERLKKVTEDLANLAPEAVKGYDSEGNAILDLNIALQAMVEKKREALELDKKQAEMDLKKAQADLKNLQLTKKNTEEGLQGYLAYNPRNPEPQTQKANKKIAELNVQIHQKQIEIEALRAKLGEIPNEIKNTNVDSIKAEIKAQQDAEKARRETERKRQEAEAKKAAEIEKAKKLIQDRAKAEEEIENRIYELSHSETEVKMREVEKQEAEYRKLGLSEVEIAKWKAGEIKKIEEESYQTAREKAVAEIEAKRQLNEQALSNLDTYMQHEVDMGRMTTQQLIGYYRELADNQMLTEEQRIEYARKAELMEKEINDRRAESHKETMEKIKQQNEEMVDGMADLATGLLTGTTKIEDVFKQMGTNILKEWIKTLFKMNQETQKSGIINAIMQVLGYLGGGSTSNIPTGSTTSWENTAAGVATLQAHTGALVEPIRAHSGWMVNKLQPDEVPAILQTQERVLSRNQNKDLEQTLETIKNRENQKEGDVHFHFNCIDGENAAKFIYDNRDNIVGIVQSNRKNGGVLRGDVD